jgi:hypothetical protein
VSLTHSCTVVAECILFCLIGSILSEEVKISIGFTYIVCCIVCRIPTLAAWGTAGAAAFLFFGEPVPLVRRDLLSRLPIVGKIWTTPKEE